MTTANEMRVSRGVAHTRALVGGLYYGFAALLHLPQKNKNAKEYTAMISDAFASVILLVSAARLM